MNTQTVQNTNVAGFFPGIQDHNPHQETQKQEVRRDIRTILDDLPECDLQLVLEYVQQRKRACDALQGA